MVFLALIFLVSGIFVAVEVWGRLVKNWKTALEPRPFHPYFVSGDFIGDSTSGKEYFWGQKGPIAAGNDLVAGALIHRFEISTVSARSCSSFLYDHYLSRYSAEKVEAITFGEPNAVRIFVLGNSAAQGAGATSKEQTWHCRLEEMLRRHFPGQSIYVFNAAMGGFVTTQERIAFDFAIAPYRPDAVIVLNGYIDVSVPLERCAIPGDSRFTSKRYVQIYDRSFMSFLRAHSVLADRLSRSKVRKALARKRAEVLQDPVRSACLHNNIVAVYWENVKYLGQRCQDMDIPCRIFLQPWQNLLDTDSRKLSREALVFLNEVYRNISDRISADMGESLIDISSSFNAPQFFSSFMDFCHFDDEGQRHLAEVIFPDVVDAVAQAIQNISRRATVDVVTGYR